MKRVQHSAWLKEIHREAMFVVDVGRSLPAVYSANGKQCASFSTLTGNIELIISETIQRTKHGYSF
jgi:DNA-binding IclR family transcriptional regulator